MRSRMMPVWGSGLILSTVAFTPAARAAVHVPITEKYLTVGSVEKKSITEDELSALTSVARPVTPNSDFMLPLTTVPVPGASVLGSLAGGDGSIDPSDIVNTAKAIWDIIVKNQPVSNFEPASANALPKNVTAWSDLTGWQTPETRVFQVTYKNLYNMTVVDFAYRVIYTYGGRYDGKGRYLTAVTIVPAYLDVNWGYKFDAKVEIPSVANAGSLTNPMASMELQLQWKISTIIRHDESTKNFYVRGDGFFQELD